MPALRSRPARLALRTLRDVVVAVVIWQFWQLLVSLFLTVPPRLAVMWLCVVSALFVWCHALRGGAAGPRAWATARVRRIPRGAVPWLLALAPLLAIGALAMWALLTSTGLVHDEPLPRRLQEYGNQRGGEAVLWLLIVWVAPLVEEFAFRGWIQRPLERRLGAGWAIALTALGFALAHLEPGGIPIRLAGGAALGYAVWATRSIWAGVALHMAWNAGVLVFGSLLPGFDPVRHGASLALPAAAALVGSAAAYAWAAPRLRRGSRVRSAPRRRQARAIQEY